jgi:uncharacterized protein YdhG (YjbR/CyaY superfamily)
MATRSLYSNFSDVDEYLLSLDEGRRSSLAKLRAVIHRTVPEAKEMMRYNMPYYEYKGMLCAYTAQKDYLSFYVLDDERVEKFRGQLPGLTISKGCIRFQDFADLPVEVIERLLAEAVAFNESHNAVGR